MTGSGSCSSVGARLDTAGGWSRARGADGREERRGYIAWRTDAAKVQRGHGGAGCGVGVVRARYNA